MICFQLYCAASSASSVSCRLAESAFHHSEFLTLKSPIYIAIVGGQSLILMIVSSHRCLDKENCSMLCLGERYKTVKKKRLEAFWISQARHSSSVVKLGLRASGKWSLKYKQTPPFCKLEGWSQRTSFYPSIASFGPPTKSKSLKKFRWDKRYQIDGHLKRLKFARVGKILLPIYYLNSNDKQIRSISTHPVKDWLQYPTIAWWCNSCKACKKVEIIII